MAKLRCVEGAIKNKEIVLKTGKNQVFGRASSADVTIDDPLMSSAHAEFRSVEGGWTLQDLGSSNGTTVNGETIGKHVLGDRDEVNLGDTVFLYLAEAPQAGPDKTKDKPAPAPVPGPAPAPEAKPEAVMPKAVDAKPKPDSIKRRRSAKSTPEDVQRVLAMTDKTGAIRNEVAKVIVGQLEVVDQVLMCLIAGGHGLLIGLPGMAKTLLVSTLAKVLDLEFRRIQFTPDLMPSDITGTEVLNTNQATGEKEFRFIRGPIFCNLLLADEINRTPPKTQAALLEAMQERSVTVGNMSHKLEPPFFALATQNPIEQEGTYPLPEAQLDRFMFNIWVDYPMKDEEHEIVGSTTSGEFEEPNCVLSREEVIELQRIVRHIPVSEHVIRYVIELVRATRPACEEAPEVTKKYVSTGAGPRAGQYLVLAGKARAALDGRIHVSCGDIRGAAGPVLRHRILTNFAADSEGIGSMDIVNQLVKSVAEPDENVYEA